MPYNSGTGAYERRSTTVIDATPDGDTVAVAIDVKLDQGIDDYVVDLNHHKTNGNHYPATSVHTDSRFLGQTPAGVVEWKDGVPAPDAALKDFSNVADGAVPIEKLESGILPAQIAGTAYVKTNIIGTVSQSIGVPTGAIIERGSNANGEYVRFADGTQICTGESSSILCGDVWYSGIYSGQEVLTFPAAFAAEPRVGVSGVAWTVAGGIVSTAAIGTTQIYVNVFAPNNTATGKVRYIAVGRWF